MKIYTYKGKKNLCGDRIRIERLKKRMTQMELAAKIQLQGITLERDSISRIENRDKVCDRLRIEAICKGSECDG